MKNTVKAGAAVFAIAALAIGSSACDGAKRAGGAGASIARIDDGNAAASIRAQARALALALSDGELAGQLIMGGIDAAPALDAGERARLERVKPGAIMLFRKNLATDKRSIRNMTAEIAALYDDASGGRGAPAPFIAVDNEGGAVHRFGAEVERLPSALSYGNLAKMEGEAAALKKIGEDARRAAREMAALGINMNLAPVAELLDDDNASFLGERSYGSESDWVRKASIAFVEGMRKGNVACVIKHFPGNSGVDPHKSLPYLRGADVEKKAAVFYEVLAQAAPSGVMISHAVVQAWDGARNASLSPIVIQDNLIAKGNFGAIILADDFSMGAVSSALSVEENCVAALNAGCSMVMAWPANLASVHNAILVGLRDGTLARKTLVDAASRIIEQKLRLGLIPEPTAASE
ncbi:MAG: glycoside hydrolase family 3 protein [Spirochaetaceae bacterium]|jgi:beta-N-acetylhexosaminidase|nr:glycoside hydrolase family 3 protein [Spirochaetaceae bacterium]